MLLQNITLFCGLLATSSNRVTMSDPIFSSMHTHTVFCDGSDDIETMCRAAYENKLFAIGFSAHASLTQKTGIKTFWNLPDEKADEYVQEVLAAKKRWQNKLKVFLGFEVDYIKGMRSAKDSDLLQYNPDFLIGSVHFLVPPKGEPLLTIDGSQEEFDKLLNEGFGGDILALMHAYYDTVAEMINIGGFEILGHADLIKKNCFGKNLWPYEEEEHRQKEIANLLVNTNIAAEANTGGINRKKFNETCPSPSFLRFLCENNVPVIITADAHRAEHIAGNYDTAAKVLIDAGYKEHVLFTGKVDGKAQWQKQTLG